MSIHRYKVKNSSGWRAIVQLSAKKQISKVFRRRVDAEVWEAEQKQLSRSGAAATLAPNLTVRELAERWQAGPGADRREQSSNHRYEVCIRRQIIPSLGEQRVAELTPLIIEDWLRHIRSDQGLSARTVNLCLAILKKMVADAVRWQLIRFSPIATASRLPQAELDFQFWTRDEVTAFLACALETAPNYHAVYCLALYTGMRKGEIQALKWDSVDLETRQITVKRTFCVRTMAIKERTKSKRVRRVPINGPLREVLIEQRQKTEDVVFPSFDFFHACDRIAAIAKRAGVPAIRFHDLRHTFASHFVMGGGPIYKLQRLLGHSTVQMTERYSHLSPDHLADATELLDFSAGKAAEVLSLRRG